MYQDNSKQFLHTSTINPYLKYIWYLLLSFSILLVEKLVHRIGNLPSDSITKRQRCGSLASQSPFIPHIIIQIAMEVTPSPSFEG